MSIGQSYSVNKPLIYFKLHFFDFLFFKTVLLYSLYCLQRWDPSVSSSWVLGWWDCTVMPSINFYFLSRVCLSICLSVCLSSACLSYLSPTYPSIYLSVSVSNNFQLLKIYFVYMGAIHRLVPLIQKLPYPLKLKVVSCLMLVLGIEFVSSSREIFSFKHWAVGRGCLFISHLPRPEIITPKLYYNTAWPII